MNTLKGKISVFGSDSFRGNHRIPAGRQEFRFLNRSLTTGQWLHSIRFTPEPDDGLMLHDIRVGNNSLFACGHGPVKAQLLNQFPLTFKVLEVVPPESQVVLFLSGAYEGECEIEIIPPIPGERFLNTCLMPIEGRTQVQGVVKEIIVTKELRALLQEKKVELLLFRAYGEEFAHQVFDDIEYSQVVIKSDGRATLDKPIRLNVSERLMYGAGVGSPLAYARFGIGSTDMVAILEPIPFTEI